MKVLLQRVKRASVEVDGETVGKIGIGALVFVGIAAGDTPEQVHILARKTLGLRMFPDVRQVMNLNVMDAAAELLVVSQFTLVADTAKGHRPGYSCAAPPEQARLLYNQFVDDLSAVLPVQTGRFGADMQVSLVNDGPVTFMLERTP